MNISERIFNPRNKKSCLGIAHMDSEFDSVAVYMIDYGADQSSYFEILSINKSFPLHFKPLSDGNFQYIVHGSVVARSPKPEEIQEEICESKGDALTIDDLFSREMDPLFKDVHHALPDDHERFQEALERNGFWVLVIKSSTDTYIYIERRFGIMVGITETSRQETKILNPG